jgi:hypothetical protein
MQNATADLNLVDNGPSFLTLALQSTARKFERPSDKHVHTLPHYYALRARYDGIWFGILLGATESDVRNRIPLALAALPGATFEFGKNVRKYDAQEHSHYWIEELLPM